MMGQVAVPRDLDPSSPRRNTAAPDDHRDSAYQCIGTTEQNLVHGSFYLPLVNCANSPPLCQARGAEIARSVGGVCYIDLEVHET